MERRKEGRKEGGRKKRYKYEKDIKMYTVHLHRVNLKFLIGRLRRPL